MSFVLSAEQEAIRQTARKFMAERAPVAHLRRLRDERSPLGYSPEVWSEMASLGFAGLLYPERFGGLGLGYAELGLVLEEQGRTLAPTPLFATAVLAGNALLLGGTEEQREATLPALCAGESLLSLAHDEGTRHARHRVKTRAEPAEEGFLLTGEKVFVLDGHVAGALVVSTRTAGSEGDRDGLSLFLVPATAAGLHVTRTSMIDDHGAARARLEGVRVPAGALVGELHRGAEVLDAVLDRAAIALSAEMLGGIQEAFDRTVAYLKERRQFGVPIGSFQALQHRAAWMFCEIELCKSIVYDALRAIDEGRADVPRLASAAKARASDVFMQVAGEAIQMHGGVGVTDELDIGFFLKRAKVAEATLGDSAYHRDRFARLSGY